MHLPTTESRYLQRTAITFYPSSHCPKGQSSMRFALNQTTSADDVHCPLFSALSIITFHVAAMLEACALQRLRLRVVRCNTTLVTSSTVATWSVETYGACCKMQFTYTLAAGSNYCTGAQASVDVGKLVKHATINFSCYLRFAFSREELEIDSEVPA